MFKNIVGISVALLTLTGCSSSGESISVPVPPEDFTGRVCESPIYQEILGTFSGELQFSAGGRFCMWNATVTVTPAAVSDDLSCEIEGTIALTLLQQGAQTDIPFVCDTGVRDVEFANGLGVGDDLTTVRPVSLGFNFLPFLEQTDAAGNQLVPAVTQFQFGIVDLGELILDNGTLEKQ